MDLTISGKLPIGLDAKPTKFTLRMGKVSDSVNAITEVGTENSLRLSAAVIARQLTELGHLKPEQITTEVIVDLFDLDFNTIEAARVELEKKFLPPKET